MTRGSSPRLVAEAPRSPRCACRGGARTCSLIGPRRRSGRSRARAREAARKPRRPVPKTARTKWRTGADRRGPGEPRRRRRAAARSPARSRAQARERFRGAGWARRLVRRLSQIYGSVGTSVRDRRYEVSIAKTTASARGTNRDCATPASIEHRDEDDADAQRRDNAGTAIWSAPSRIARTTGLSWARFRWTFSMSRSRRRPGCPRRATCRRGS